MTDSATDRLLQLAERAGLRVDRDPATRLIDYLDAMLEENRQVNLTGVRDRDVALSLHVCDSLAVQLADVTPARALDLGSGNGFPGIAVKLLWSRVQLTLLDRTEKKLRAIERALERARIADVATIHADAAQLPALGVGRYDLITARAIAPPAELCELAEPLLTPTGKLAAWLSTATADDLPATALPLEAVYRYELADRRSALAVFTAR